MEWHLGDQYYIYADTEHGRYKICKAWVPSRGWVYTSWAPRPINARGYRSNTPVPIRVSPFREHAQAAAEQHAGMKTLLRCLCAASGSNKGAGQPAEAS